jgi:hypothetical protein
MVGRQRHVSPIESGRGWTWLQSSHSVEMPHTPQTPKQTRVTNSGHELTNPSHELGPRTHEPESRTRATNSRTRVTNSGHELTNEPASDIVHPHRADPRGTEEGVGEVLPWCLLKVAAEGARTRANSRIRERQGGGEGEGGGGVHLPSIRVRSHLAAPDMRSAGKISACTRNLQHQTLSAAFPTKHRVEGLRSRALRSTTQAVEVGGRGFRLRVLSTGQGVEVREETAPRCCHMQDPSSL